MATNVQRRHTTEAAIAQEEMKPIGKSEGQATEPVIVVNREFSEDSIITAFSYQATNRPMFDLAMKCLQLGPNYLKPADERIKAVIDSDKVEESKKPTYRVKRSEWRMVAGAALFCRNAFVHKGTTIDEGFDLSSMVAMAWQTVVVKRAREALAKRGLRWDGSTNKAGPQIPKPSELQKTMESLARQRGIKEPLSELPEEKREALMAAAQAVVNKKHVAEKLKSMTEHAQKELKGLFNYFGDDTQETRVRYERVGQYLQVLMDQYTALADELAPSTDGENMVEEAVTE